MATTVTIDGSPEIEITLIDESPEISVELHDESPVIQVEVIGTGPVGPGVPAGGTTGQFLKKKSGTDYDTEWTNIVYGINLTGTYVDPHVVVTLDPLGVSAVSIYNAFNNGKPVYLVADLSLYYPSIPATPVRYPLISVRRYGSLMFNYEFVFAGETPSINGEATITFSDVAALATSMSGVADVEFGDDLARSEIGDLSDLDTTAKSDLVAAINELAQGGGGGTSNYNDLTNKPQIGGVTLSGNKSLADIGAGTYSKPSGGIPASDLASAVQTSLGKADTALQSAPVTSVNSKTGAVTLSASDVGAGTYSKPSGGIPSSDMASAVQTSLGKADTAYQKPSGGIPASDLASAVQTSLGKADTALQSYTETDPTVPSWAKAASKPTYTPSEVGAAPAVTEVTVSTAGAVTQAIDAGKIYHFTGALTSLTITLNAAASGVIAQYHFDFNSGSTAPTVTLPNSVTMQGGTFTPEASKHYEVDILNGYGVYMAW